VRAKSLAGRGQPGSIETSNGERWLLCPSIILDQAQKGYSDLIDVVATGSPQDESVQCADLWPVRVGIVFTQEDGPQGRGYSSAYCGILLKSLSLWAGKMPPCPHSQDGCVTLH
jgi:hypothetical protein